MANNGMGFRLTLTPFTVVGEVGGEVHMHTSVSGNPQISSREDFNDMITALEKIRDEVCALHDYAGEWGVRFAHAEASDGVSV